MDMSPPDYRLDTPMATACPSVSWYISVVSSCASHVIHPDRPKLSLPCTTSQWEPRAQVIVKFIHVYPEYHWTEYIFHHSGFRVIFMRAQDLRIKLESVSQLILSSHCSPLRSLSRSQSKAHWLSVSVCYGQRLYSLLPFQVLLLQRTTRTRNFGRFHKLYRI